MHLIRRFVSQATCLRTEHLIQAMPLYDLHHRYCTYPLLSMPPVKDVDGIVCVILVSIQSTTILIYVVAPCAGQSML